MTPAAGPDAGSVRQDARIAGSIAPQDTALHRTTGGTLTGPGPREDELHRTAERAKRLIRRLSFHLGETPPSIPDASLSGLFEHLGHQITEVLADVGETCAHLERLGRDGLGTPLEVHGPGTAAVRELRHGLRELRARLTALASGDQNAHGGYAGVCAAELAQLRCALNGHGDSPHHTTPAPTEDDTSIRIKAQGTLDAFSLSNTLDALEEAAEEGAIVLLDMSDIGYTDPSGVSLIRRYAKKLAEMGGDLLLVGVCETVMETFELLGLDRELCCFASVEEAERALEEAGWHGRPARNSFASAPARLLAAALLQ